MLIQQNESYHLVLCQLEVGGGVLGVAILSVLGENVIALVRVDRRQVEVRCQRPEFRRSHEFEEPAEERELGQSGRNSRFLESPEIKKSTLPRQWLRINQDTTNNN